MGYEGKAFANNRDIIKRIRTELMKLSFFQNVDLLSVLEKTQPTGHIKKEHEIIILDPYNFDLKVSENEKIFLNSADF